MSLLLALAVPAALPQHQPPPPLASSVCIIPGLPAASTPPPTGTPLHALWLSARCVGLKALLVEKQTQITALEEQARASQAQHARDAEKIAELHRRNRELTTALHRTACAG